MIQKCNRNLGMPLFWLIVFGHNDTYEDAENQCVFWGWKLNSYTKFTDRLTFSTNNFSVVIIHVVQYQILCCDLAGGWRQSCEKKLVFKLFIVFLGFTLQVWYACKKTRACFGARKGHAVVNWIGYGWHGPHSLSGIASESVNPENPFTNRS